MIAIRRIASSAIREKMILQSNVKLTRHGMGNDKKQPCGIRGIMQTLGGKWILHIHYKECGYGASAGFVNSGAARGLLGRCRPPNEPY
ncbi:hypothetical protein [Azospirillum baldaniorum]|uniref:hypothetical protein n=1 Tax=Azospirillum baldaniorum TaxID=1064539 RepID=UPI00157B08C6|nr:hypothetical protein [Azospirillum baldaniorum]